MDHWRKVFDKVQVTYGTVRNPRDVIRDPQPQ
jgi:crotonobetainyl-CoA:carnitine CoA-transferase CaiB-like acyl-CoA transferase